MNISTLESLYQSLSNKNLISKYENIISNSTALPIEYFDILHFYFENPSITQREIASKLFISMSEFYSRLNKLKYVFKAKESVTLLLCYLTCLYQMKNGISLYLFHIVVKYEICIDIKKI